MSRAGLLFRGWTQWRTVLLGGLEGGCCTDRERPPSAPPLRYTPEPTSANISLYRNRLFEPLRVPHERFARAKKTPNAAQQQETSYRMVVGVAAGTLLPLSCMHLSWWWFCEFWMSTHAKMCYFSTVTAPLSTLDELGVVCVAAGPAKGRSDLKNRVGFAHLLVRTRPLLFQCCSPQRRRAARPRPRRPARPNICLRCRQGRPPCKAAKLPSRREQRETQIIM